MARDDVLQASAGLAAPGRRTDADRGRTPMSSIRTTTHGLRFVAAAIGAMLALPAPVHSAEPHVITLTQTGCQFLESEAGIDHDYEPVRAEDCEAINAETAGKRLARAPVLELPPGRYRFRVTNRDVPYDLGFWLRGAGAIGRARLPSVSGGGLARGATRDYEIELVPGDYVYSCPLNPTPDYPLAVRG